MNDDEYATCPYNSSHRVPHSRIQHHLIKCQKTNPALMICPFNATHRYPEHLMKNHCSNCQSKKPNDAPKAGQEESIGAITAPKPILQKEYLPEMDPENDCWDD